MITKEEIKEYLSDLICESMYMEKEELEEEMLFSDFGLESTTLVKIIAKTNQKFSSNIEAKELLLYQTLNSSSDYIFEHITKQKNYEH